MGRYGEAQGYLEESLAIARELGDKGRIAALLQTLSLVSLGQGDLAAARVHLREALASARELGDKRRIAAALNALAQVHRLEGQLDTAEPLYDQVLSLARELGDSESIAIALLNLAMVSIGRSSVDRAQSILREALSIAEDVGSKPAGQSVLEVSAGLGAVREEWERAADSLEPRKARPRNPDFTAIRQTRRSWRRSSTRCATCWARKRLRRSRQRAAHFPMTRRWRRSGPGLRINLEAGPPPRESLVVDPRIERIDRRGSVRGPSYVSVTVYL